MRDFDQVVESFKDCVREQWEDPTVRRAFKIFRTNFRKTLDNDNTLVHVMFIFTKETSQNINVGRKRKHSFGFLGLGPGLDKWTLMMIMMKN